MDIKGIPSVPDEDIPPEIQREMTIPVMTIPEFKPFIKEEDLEDFEERDKKMLLAMSVLEQRTDFIIHWLNIVNVSQRSIQAEQIRQRNEQRRAGILWSIFKWATVTLGAGAIAGLAKRAFEKFWP